MTVIVVGDCLSQGTPILRSALIDILRRINEAEGDGPVCFSNYMESTVHAQVTGVLRGTDGRVVLVSEDGCNGTDIKVLHPREEDGSLRG